MTPELKEKILEAVPPYPSVNDDKVKEAGYHEAIDSFIKVFDAMIEADVS